MERQHALILFLALSLLVTLRGLVFAELSTLMRAKTPKHNEFSKQTRESNTEVVTSSVPTLRQGETLDGIARVRGSTVRVAQISGTGRKKKFRSTSEVSEPTGGRLLSAPEDNKLADRFLSEAITGQTRDTSGSKPGTLRARLVNAASEFLGAPYRWSGMSKQGGVDCSGLVKMVFAKLHIELPRTSREQIQSGEEVTMDKLKIGDLVFFSSNGATPNHVGLYIGDSQFVHAEKKAGQVIITDLTQRWYAERFLGARRVIDLGKGEKKPKEALEELGVTAN
jgi:cell wall-associated NlpC family hydrolase